jgi:hypothetical protein
MANAPERPPKREDLLDLYKIALDEYRFQVRLNWDRTQYYLVLNVGILGAGVALLKLDLPIPIRYLVALVFLGGVILALVGATAIRRTHNYYRRTVYHKAAIEALLGLWTPEEIAPGCSVPLAICTTSTMQRGIDPLCDPAAQSVDAPLSRGSATWLTVSALRILALLHLAGTAAVVLL